MHNEFTNINKVLSVDFSDENNITSENLKTVFDAVDSMALFKDKKVKVYLGGLHMKGRSQGKEICVYSYEKMNEVSETIYNQNITLDLNTNTSLTIDNKVSKSEDSTGINFGVNSEYLFLIISSIFSLVALTSAIACFSFSH